MKGDWLGLKTDDALSAQVPELLALERARRQNHAQRLRAAVQLRCAFERRLPGTGPLAVHELALSWDLTQHAAELLLRQGLQVLLVLPQVLEALEEGILAPEMSAELLDAVDGLEDELAVEIADKVLAEVAAGRLRNRSQVRSRARRLVAAARPGDAEQRRQDAFAARDVRVFELPDGMMSLLLTHGAAQVRRIQARIAARAADFAQDDARDLPPDQRRTADQRRADAMVELLCQTGGLLQNGDGVSGDLPGVFVTVPVQTALDVDDAPGELHAQRGPAEPITAQAVRGMVADGAELCPVFVDDETGEILSVGSRPVRPGRDPAAIRAALTGMADEGERLSASGARVRHPRGPGDHERPPDDPRVPATAPPPADRVDEPPAAGGEHLPDSAGAYRPPRWMRRLTKLRARRCEFPGCTSASLRCDLDHDVAWPDGPTCPCNLGPLCRHHHRVKQSGWTKQRLDDGSVRWTSPAGQVATVWPEPLDLGRTTRPLPACAPSWWDVDDSADRDPARATAGYDDDLDHVPSDVDPEDDGGWGERLARLDGDELAWALLKVPADPVDWTLDGEVAAPRVLRRRRRSTAGSP